ncbi:hypothetical protein HID58_012530 [Brassica napus]|uniref:Uncharacterized protein n=1 Tax=Brassica napus TaxID=3708 RepID=A0ABQ8E1B9_BRANA|nr:hypothetical protein HID58_012530 [Brassica napus]
MAKENGKFFVHRKTNLIVKLLKQQLINFLNVTNSVNVKSDTLTRYSCFYRMRKMTKGCEELLAYLVVLTKMVSEEL